uniref:Uncharacterized protein n=1 Tax=Panagrellus redivivus TaxID=6233 RepID=A0A7E4VXP3_PANRE
MHPSSLILFLFVYQALQQNTHDIQKYICTADIKIDEERNTLIKLHKSGSSCQYLPLIVDRTGFNFDFVFPANAAHGELGFLDLLFENSPARVSLRFQKRFDEMIVYSSGRYLTTVYSTTATITVSADGRGYIHHGNAAGIILFPELTNLPTFATDKAVLKVKFIWRDLFDGFNVRFPPEIGFLADTTTTTTTGAVIPFFM